MKFVKGELNLFINLIFFIFIYLFLILLTLVLLNYIDIKYVFSLFFIYFLLFIYVTFRSMLFILKNKISNIWYKILSILIFSSSVISLIVVTLFDLGF